MRNYELAFIIEPNTDAEGVTGVVEGVSQFIKTASGKVASVDVWGRKRLAYPINRHKDGTYVVIEASMEPSGILEFERSMKLTEQVMRYMLIAKEDQ